MKRLLAILLLLLPAVCFGQEGTPVKSITGSGVPGGAVAHIVGTEYLDISQIPPVLYTCSSLNIAAGPSPPAGTITCNWTTIGSGGITSVSSLPATCTPGTTAPVQLTVAAGANPVGLYGCAGPPAPANTWFLIGPGTSNYNTFTNQFYGLSPKDYGAFGDSKTCYDGQSSGGTNFTSAMPAETITNTVINNGLQDYTVSGGNNFVPGQTVTITGTTNGGGVFNGTFIVFRNTFAPGFTVLTANGNVASAADTGTATSTCANFTSADAGKYIDIYGAGAAGVILHTTISSVTNGVVTLGNAITPGSLTSVKFRYGHDDTTALQSWVTAINNGSLTANNLLVHSGYIPRGFFYSTKPLRFVNPLGGPCCSLGSLGSPEPFQNSNASEGLSIMGTGASTSGIVYAPGAAFSWGCVSGFNQTNNTGQFYYGGNNLINGGGQWNWTNLYGFALIDDNDGVTSYNTSLCTQAGILVSDGSAHENVGGIEVVGGHNTTGTLPDWIITGICYESHFHDMQLYSGDGAANFGSGPANAGASFEHCSWDNIKFKGGLAGSTIPNVTFNISGNGGTAVLGKITNSAFGIPIGAGTGALLLQFNTAAPGELFIIENTDFLSNSATYYGINLPNVAANSFILSLNNVHLKNTAASAATNLILNSSPAMNILISGGDFDCNTTCANGISNAAGSNIYTNSTFNIGNFAGVSGTGAATVFQQTPNATGWGGAGNWQASSFSTLTNCAVNSVSPAACGSSAAGAFVVPTTTTTYTVNTTAVTAASRITLTPMSFAGNLPSAPTCVVPTTPFIATVSAIVAGTSFTITTPSTTGQTCWMYQIEN